jgi:uncharacterized membrane protein
MSERGLRLTVAALATVGLGIASYLTAVRYAGGTVVCATGGCETVQSSSYSELLGVPVAVLGIAGYLLVLLAALARGERPAVAGFALALTGFVFGLYLIYVQVALIGAVCQWCVASDAVMSALLAATVLRVRSTARVVYT